MPQGRADGHHQSVISGIVIDAQGKPVSLARVYFVESPVAVPDVAALTGPDGRFSLSAPVEGRYAIECTADEFKPRRLTVEVPMEELLKVQLQALHS